MTQWKLKKWHKQDLIELEENKEDLHNTDSSSEEDNIEGLIKLDQNKEELVQEESDDSSKID